MHNVLKCFREKEWDPNYEAKAGPGVLWVSRGYLWLRPQSGAGMPWEGTEAPQVFPDSAQGTFLFI